MGLKFAATALRLAGIVGATTGVQNSPSFSTARIRRIVRYPPCQPIFSPCCRRSRMASSTASSDN